MAAAAGRAPPLDMPLFIVPGPDERLNPRKWFDLADSASFACWSCRQYVYLACGTTPAECGLSPGQELA